MDYGARLNLLDNLIPGYVQDDDTKRKLPKFVLVFDSSRNPTPQLSGRRGEGCRVQPGIDACLYADAHSYPSTISRLNSRNSRGMYG